MPEDVYVNVDELKKRGFVKKDGLYYKQTLIERYHAKGWLDFGDRRLTADDRLNAAEVLQRDFEKSRFPASKAVDLSTPRVDGGNMKNEPDSVLRARDRYFKAVQAVSGQYWLTVRTICLYNEPEETDCAVNDRRYKHELEMIKDRLCRGLDNLVFHYGINLRRPQIKGMNKVDIWEDFTEYLKRIKK